MATKKSTGDTAAGGGKAAKKPTVEARLAAVRALEQGPTPETVGALQAALADVWLVVAAAADFAREQAIYTVAGDLVGAYTRLASAERGDPNVTARVAIVRALDALSRWDDDVFAAALATRTSVPPGSHEDSGAMLRSAAALAHVSFGRDDSLDVLAALLADRAPSARRAAAHYLGGCGRREAAALVRFKLLSGDEDADVVQQLAESLLTLQADRAVPFLVPLLRVRIAADATAAEAHALATRAEVVALALGGARATDALPALIAWSNACAPADRARVGFLPIALLRDDTANAWLAERITDQPADALAAARALATFASDPAIADQIRAAAADQRDPRCRSGILALVD